MHGEHFFFVMSFRCVGFETLEITKITFPLGLHSYFPFVEHLASRASFCICGDNYNGTLVYGRLAWPLICVHHLWRLLVCGR